MTERTIYQAVENSRKAEQSEMRFQARDGEILQTIHEHDGVLAKRQLKEMFWGGMSQRAMEKRLAKLHQGGYINWPTREEWRNRAIPEPLCWLGWKGILWIAGKEGIAVEQPNNHGENKMRSLEKQLREQGMRWQREPRWIQLAHDLAVIDFRLMVNEAVRRTPHLTLEEWKHEGAFRSEMDVIEFQVGMRDGKGRKERKGVCPDSYFVITDHHRQEQGVPARGRFLLEMDMSTHDNPSFGREKVLPGIAYLLSRAYRQRFGDNSGRWLVVTTGERRMENLMRQAWSVAGGSSAVFHFATFDQLNVDKVLTEPIWHWPGSDQTIALL